MRSKITGLILFLAQVYLTFKGIKHFGKYWSPAILFIVGVAVGLIWLFQLLRTGKTNEDTERVSSKPTLLKSILGGLGGTFLFLLTYEELRKRFAQFTPPSKFSDVLPQIETLFHRFATGEFPYKPVDVTTHIAYPVYLPMHWLPVGLTQLGIVDVRWTGYLLLVLAAGIFSFFLYRQTAATWSKIVALALPSIVLWGYILWGENDIPVSYELVIAAYYLILAVALGLRKWGWLAVGLSLCLLSRYTLVFWLPLFALMFWQKEGMRRSIWLWGTITAAVLMVYIFPFLIKEPGILKEGLAYHNGAAIAEWKGYGEPPVSWSMERGIHFAPHLKAMIGGDAEHQVFVAREIQAAVMLLLLGLGIWGYRRTRHQIHPYDLGLLMLYFVILCFYAFGPLTYRYYMIVPLMLSAVICGKILMGRDDNTMTHT